MDLSIIIPVYNAGGLITRCLDSVFSQRGDYDIEVIAIDDGSTDNSVELIEQYPERERITLLRQQNSGPSVARNRGIDVATGRYLAFLDADDYWLPGFIPSTIEFIEQHAECIAVSVVQRHLTTSGEHEAPRDWANLAPVEGVVLDDFYAFWAKHNHVCTGSILIRSEIAKQTGGMRPDLRICEDLEFWAYLATFGKIGYIPQLLFVSDGSKVTKSIGWVEKHLPRWNAAVGVEDWQKRISTKIDVEQVPGLVIARGRIARNLAYSILMSKRYQLAYQQIKLYSDTYPKDRMTQLLRLSVKNKIYWFIISRALVFREYHR